MLLRQRRQILHDLAVSIHMGRNGEMFRHRDNVLGWNDIQSRNRHSCSRTRRKHRGRRNRRFIRAVSDGGDGRANQPDQPRRTSSHSSIGFHRNPFPVYKFSMQTTASTRRPSDSFGVGLNPPRKSDGRLLTLGLRLASPIVCWVVRQETDTQNSFFPLPSRPNALAEDPYPKCAPHAAHLPGLQRAQVPDKTAQTSYLHEALQTRPNW